MPNVDDSEEPAAEEAPEVTEATEVTEKVESEEEMWEDEEEGIQKHLQCLLLVLSAPL